MEQSSWGGGGSQQQAEETEVVPDSDELLGVSNPWSTENLEDFLFYCCPQCDHQARTRVLFLNHAFLSHPEVSIFK